MQPHQKCSPTAFRTCRWTFNSSPDSSNRMDPPPSRYSFSSLLLPLSSARFHLFNWSSIFQTEFKTTIWWRYHGEIGLDRRKWFKTDPSSNVCSCDQTFKWIQFLLLGFSVIVPNLKARLCYILKEKELSSEAAWWQDNKELSRSQTKEFGWLA